jgi:plastocyanin
MRKLLALVPLAGLVVALFAAGPALSARKTVEVDDNYFVDEGRPSTVRVRRNDIVVWRWEGRTREPHNVTVTRGPVEFRSRTKRSGTYRKRMTRRGTYRIVCTVHAPQMRMTLRVR